MPMATPTQPTKWGNEGKLVVERDCSLDQLWLKFLRLEISHTHTHTHTPMWTQCRTPPRALGKSSFTVKLDLTRVRQVLKRKGEWNFPKGHLTMIGDFIFGCHNWSRG